MKTAFFPRLAWSGICKNRKLYIPYLLSCIGMVMMYYILQFLSYSPLLEQMRGGSSLGFILALGRFVVAAFALLFLFYTNSFLVRRRYKEFGLYNILGMDKHKIGRVILWESLIVSGIGLAGGLGFGIALSKLAELGLINTIRKAVDYRFTLSGKAILITVAVFAVIFFLLTVKSLWQVRRCKPLELLRSEAAGEKPPKANFVFAIVGVLLLGTAYYLAVSTRNAMDALISFFISVLMVIVATYLLFMSGSVALCKVLQKNKRYYYQKQHFVSVSSMAYRMKRNGAGLASICILATMVLVMISSTTSLYFGANDSLRSRFPLSNEINIGCDSVLTDEDLEETRRAYEGVFAAHSFTPQNVSDYRYATITGLVDGDTVNPDSGINDLKLDYNAVRTLYFVSVNDYNHAMGTTLALNQNEALVHPYRCQYRQEKLCIGNVRLTVAGTLDDFMEIGDASVTIFPSLMIVIPDYETLAPLDLLTDSYENRMLAYHYYYGYDATGSDEEAIAVFHDQQNSLTSLSFISESDINWYTYTGGCLAEQRDDFFITFGGLFFLGILLSVVFIFAAAMIIYYKQISEGYEDKERFSIMQKVGMTKTDIKKSINSQIVTVFFAPLLMAGIHLCFAFPLIWTLLQLFNLHNLTLVIIVTAIAFVCFGIFYALLYKATAKAYYSIVSHTATE